MKTIDRDALMQELKEKSYDVKKLSNKRIYSTESFYYGYLEALKLVDESPTEERFTEEELRKEKGLMTLQEAHEKTLDVAAKYIEEPHLKEFVHTLHLVRKIGGL